MENINVKEIKELWEAMEAFGEDVMPFEDFLQSRIDTFKDDWYMYRPIVAKLEKRMIALELEVLNLKMAD